MATGIPRNHHWTEAEELVGCIGSHPRFASDPTATLSECFIILDRLAEETERTKSQGGKPRSFSFRALKSVLLSWRNCRRSNKGKPRKKGGGEVNVSSKRSSQSNSTLLGGMLESFWGYFFNTALDNSTAQSTSKQLDPDQVLKRTQRYVESGLVLPERTLFTIILSELSDLKQIQALLDWQESGNCDVGTDAITYNSALIALSDNPRFCHTIFKRLVASHKASKKKKGGQSTRVNLKHVNVVLSSWARSDQRMAAKMANSIIAECRKLGVSPDVESFTHLIMAWAKNTWVDPAVVVNVLRHMQKQQEESVAPNEFTYRAVLLGLLRSKRADALEQAESILQEMSDAGLKQEAHDYTALMLKLAEESKVERVEALWTKMKRSWEEGNVSLRPDFQSQTIRLRAWSDAGNPTMATAVLREMISLSASGVLNRKPGTNEFNLVLSAWLRSDQPDAAEKAESGLKQMMQLSATGQFDCAPNQSSHNIVIKACIKANDDCTARSILKQLKKQKDRDLGSTYKAMIDEYFALGRPARVEETFLEWGSVEDILNLGVHRTRILSWCRAGEPQKAENALQGTLNAYKEGFVQRKPNAAMFKDVIRAWDLSKRIDAAENAERVLRQCSEYDEVDLRLCNAVLWAWTTSPSPSAGLRARDLLNWMKEVSLQRPSFSSYCAVIIALLRSKGSRAEQINDLLFELSARPRSFFRGPSSVVGWERIEAEIRKGGRIFVNEELTRQFEKFRSFKKSD